MHFSATTFIALASLAVQSSLALVIPKDVSSSEINNIVAREPHFFQIREPAPDYTLYSPNPAVAGTEGSFEFKALDGEQSSEYHVKVYLENDSGSKTEVSLLLLLFFGVVGTKAEYHAIVQLANIPFDGYVASTTVNVSFDNFPDGSYS